MFKHKGILPSLRKRGAGGELFKKVVSIQLLPQPLDNRKCAIVKAITGQPDKLKNSGHPVFLAKLRMYRDTKPCFLKF